MAITEQWIRERVGLTHENLEDVKSLSLPGTYHEKISNLGTSLRKFTRLKNLDLSRNTLTSVEGLANCELLESLNLYYNGLNTLEDLSPLRHNQKLINLDLRLNPVARTEADYRLFVVNILPNLRILDDRPVRDSEREAAQSYLGPMKNGKTTDEAPPAPPKSSSKARIVPSGLAVTTMDPEDCAVLKMLAKAEQAPPINTGSSSRQPVIEEYQDQGLKQLAEEELSSHGGVSKPDHTKVDFCSPEFFSISPHRSEGTTDENVLDQETEAYTTYRGQGHFTPNPSALLREDNLTTDTCNGEGDGTTVSRSRKKNSSLISLLDLVDKYWNGSKSLHDNRKFMGLAEGLLEKVSQEHLRATQEKVMELKEENSQLRATVRSTEGLKKVKVKLEETEKLVEKLQSEITELQHENSRLKMSIYNSKEKSSSAASSYEMDQLRQENYQLQFKLKQYSQTSELAKMLQESHKSLVQTNEHLLREIEATRLKLKHEINNGANRQSCSTAIPYR